ncbi:MAG: hypothetical protein ABFD61_02155, partial [Chloroherpetonaceae bacterium]
EQELIKKAKENNSEYFQYHVVGTKKTNFKILDGKKQAICDWICENGTKDDFKNFEKIFEIIEQIIMPIRETDNIHKTIIQK